MPRLEGLLRITPGDEGIRLPSSAVASALNAKPPQGPIDSLELLVSQAPYGGELFSRFSAKLVPRFTAASLCLNPKDAEARGLEEGQQVLLEAEGERFSLPLRTDERLAAGCALVESSAALSQLVPGSQGVYCQVSKEVQDA